jgi:pimeloyl-ACP methyl ester carboxylesterase
MATDTTRLMVEASGVALEVFRDPPEPGTAPVAASHPADAFDAGTAALLRAAGGRPVVCLNPPGLGGSTGPLRPELETIADDLERARQRLGLGPWIFWGMSGGGWLGQLHAHRHPGAVAGLILESSCPCYRVRLTDPACALSPSFPAWQEPLAAAGLRPATLEEYSGPTTWTEVPGAGSVLRRPQGPALLVSPMAITPAMRAMMPAFLTFDARPWLPQLRVPTLVLAGSADPVAPLPNSQALAAAIPQATLVVIEGASHVPTAQRHPEGQRAVREFLAGVTTG